MNNIGLQLLNTDILTRFPISTFAQCSLDTDNGVILVNNTTFGIYNFDDICETLTKEFGDGKCQKPDSLDSLIINPANLKLNFIEFKNSLWDDIKKAELRMKVYESIAILKAYYGLTDQEIMNSKIYFIHKNDPKIPATHRHFHNGLCPKKFKILEEMFGIKIMRYISIDFEQHLLKKGELP